MNFPFRPAGLRQFFGRSASATRIPREPDFWRLWFIGLILYCVRWLEMIAFAIFVYQMTASALLVAVITMLRSLPMSLFGAYLGALTDKIDRRTTLLCVLALLFVTTSTLATLAHFNMLAVWHLAVASFLNGINWVADNPVRRVMIGDVVGLSRLNTAMSIDSGTNQASRIAGPAIGGVLLASVGLGGAFVLEAALAILAIAMTLLIRYRNSAEHAPAGGILSHMRSGLKAARNDVRLRSALLVTVIFNMFGWPCLAMVPVIGKDSFHLGAGGIGLLASMEGIGAVIGVFVITFFARSSQYGMLYVGGLIVQHTLIMTFALAPNAILAGAALILTGLGGSGFAITQTALIYRLTPPHLRGRMLGLLSVCIGVGPIGFMTVGSLASAIGANAAVVIVALTGLFVMALTRRHWIVLLKDPGGNENVPVGAQGK